MNLLQDTRSPIKQRSILRLASFVSGAIAIFFSAQPYINRFTENRELTTAKQTAESAQKSAIEQQSLDAELDNKAFQIELDRKRARRDALNRMGVGFVDGAIVNGQPIPLQNKPGQNAPDNSVWENMNGDRAIIVRGKAKIIKRGN